MLVVSAKNYDRIAKTLTHPVLNKFNEHELVEFNLACQRCVNFVFGWIDLDGSSRSLSAFQ